MLADGVPGTGCRLAEAVQLAEQHTQPSEGRPAPTWPWWIKAQATFLQGDLGRVCTGPPLLLLAF